MYANDIVIYEHDKTRQQAASKLTSVMARISYWCTKSRLTLNVSKAASMYFSVTKKEIYQPAVKGEAI